MINSILTDISSIKVQNCLNYATNSLSTSLERMSSGCKINSAKDDAAGCVISSKMDVRLNGLNIAQNNIQFGMSFLNTAQGTYDEISTILTRLRDLSLQASNDTYDTSARDAMQDEVDELIKELERIKKNASFNNLKLFDNYEKESTTNGNTGNGASTNSNGNGASTITTFSAPVGNNNVSTLMTNNNIDSIDSSQSPAVMSTSAQKYSVDFGENYATKDIIINGINYNINAKGVFEYEVNGDQITFLSNGTIKGDKNAKHNVVLKTNEVTFFGGDQDDVIQNEGSYNRIYTYGGNDKVILNKNIQTNYINLGDGDNEIITNGYNISDTTILGGNGNNKLTGGGDIINSYIQNIDGKDTKEYIELANGETRTIKIAGKEYTIKNNFSDTNGFSYYYDKVSDKVVFAGHNVNITGQKDISHNVELNGASLFFYGGDKNDNIIVQSGHRIYAYGGDGDDTIEANNYGAIYIYGEKGNDKITVNSRWGEVDGGEGDDIITVGKDMISTSYPVTGGLGDDTYYIEKSIEIKDNDGNNTYYIDTDGVTLTTGSSNDKYIVNANNVTINATGGNNEFIVNGNNNILNGGDGNDTFEITGDGNKIDGGLGDNFAKIDGKDNEYGNIETSVRKPLNISLQIGDGAEESIDLTLDFSLKGLNINLSNTESAIKGVDKLDEIIDEVNLELSKIGASMNRLESISELNENSIVNLSSSKSLIVDADVAKEATDYVHSQILQQVSTALFSQTGNQNRNLISSLLLG